MNSQWRSMVCGAIVVVGVCYVAVVIGHAQTSSRNSQRVSNAPPRGQSATDPEREKVWNSPNMLRARAWLQDYCSKSAQVTPEMARMYQQELANMSTNQLKLWLLKFDHDEAQRQQQYALWQQAHAAGLSHAMAATKAARQSYADINKEETEAATEEQQQLNEQQQFEQSEVEMKQEQAVGPYPYSYPGYGTHYHFHLYPYPY